MKTKKMTLPAVLITLCLASSCSSSEPSSAISLDQTTSSDARQEVPSTASIDTEPTTPEIQTNSPTTFLFDASFIGKSPDLDAEYLSNTRDLIPMQWRYTDEILFDIAKQACQTAMAIGIGAEIVVESLEILAETSDVETLLTFVYASGYAIDTYCKEMSDQFFAAYESSAIFQQIRDDYYSRR